MIGFSALSAVARRRRATPEPPPAVFNPRDLFGEADDGILLLPQQMASLRKRINGEEPATAADDLVGVAIDYRYALAKGPELIADSALATSVGWAGQIGGAGEWIHSVGQWAITSAASAGRTLSQAGRGANTGGMHQFELDLVRSAGSFGIRLGSTNIITNAASVSASGNYSWSLIGGTAEDTIRVIAVTAGATGSVSRISVKRYLGRYGRAALDAERPALKNSGSAWWLDKAGSESLKLWCPGGLAGATIGYANSAGVSILANQTVAADAELLYGERTYGVVVINRALTTDETTALQAYLAALRTGGIPEEEPQPEWVPLGTATLATFKHRFDSSTGPYALRATGANAVVATFETQSGAVKTTDLTALGLTVPATIEIEGAAMADPNLVHITIGSTGLGGAFLDISKLSGLKQLYSANNPKTGQTHPALQGLPALEIVWLHGNGANAWGSTALPATLKDLRAYDNGMSQATVDAILVQANAALLGTGCLIDLGGNNANASNAGWNTRDALVARGATVNLSGQDPRAAAPSGLKWFPGHYHFIDEPAGASAALAEITPYSIVRGIQTRFYWNELEPSLNTYDFSRIISIADTLHAAGRKLVVQVQFKTFNSAKPFPAYLMTPSYEGGVYESAKGGWNLRLWNSAVRTRLNALMEALAAACDEHPAIAAMNLAESAAPKPVATDPAASNWTYYKAQHALGLMAAAHALRLACADTPTIAYFNGSAADGVAFGAAADNDGLGLGGPDTYIGTFDNELFLRYSYELIRLRAGKIPILMGVQWNNYIWIGASSAWAHPDGATPIADLFAFNRDVLKSNFVCWQKRAPYWTNVLALWAALPTTYPGDPAGGLSAVVPELLKA